MQLQRFILADANAFLFQYLLFVAAKFPVLEVLSLGPRAGDRICDAPITSNSNSDASSLFSLLNSTRHTLLLFPATDSTQTANELLAIAAEASNAFPDIFNTHVIVKPGNRTQTIDDARVNCCVDVQYRLHEKLGVTSPALVLIRPDGYIGLKTKSANGNVLLSFMETYLQTES